MQHGDTIRIEMKGLDGFSVFGAIEQTVQTTVPAATPAAAAQAS